MKRRKLKKAGEALHISPIAPNILIAKVNSYLEPGSIIYNSNLERVGVVIETFGPVKSPYARIKLDKEPSHFHAHTSLFTIVGDRKKIIWRKMPGYKKRKRR